MPVPMKQNSADPAAVPFIGRHPGALAAIVVAILTITAILLVLAINRIQTTQLEADAIARGETWSSALISVLESVDQVFEGGQLSQKDRSTIALASRIGGLEKFIIFDAAGTAIAASDPTDLGSVNRSPYWVDSVLRGRVHATIEHQASGESGTVEPGMTRAVTQTVVAETYVPVFAGEETDRRVIGAFETYLDVTDSAHSYARIGFYASTAGIALIAAAAVIAVIFARRTLAYRLERETILAQARQSAESANRAKSSFLATVSHEIRTPMTGILATTELLEESGLNPEQKTMAGVVRRSATSLLSLLNQLLDQSKIEAGKLDIDPKPFVFASSMRAVIELFSSAASAKGLSLTVHIDDALPKAVIGDSARIEQILGNLLGNALKFTETGSITVSAVPEADRADWVRIEVSDTGIGISSGSANRLFHPFEQADRGTTRRFGGTGLGLTVSRQLAELMGGTLSVTSAPGQGSTFRLAIPLPATAIEDAGVEPSHRAPSAHLRVLVAEDDATLRWVIGRQLDRLGCATRVVEDGAAALAEWSGNPGVWDLIITDWHMPRLDGLGLVRALRESGRDHPPVIMLTASGMPEEIETARQAGVRQVLVKPVQLDGLAAALVAAERGSAAVAVMAPVADDGDDRTSVLDTSALEELSGGDREMVDHLLRDFARRLETDRHELAVADAATRHRMAHALRGAAAAVGAAGLAAACERLEHDDDAEAWTAFEQAANAVAIRLQTRLGAVADNGTNDG